MKYLTMMCVLLTFLSAKTVTAQAKDKTTQPDERVEVHKEYDEYGNLIRFDSVYSYSSGNLKGHSLKFDSLMKNFFPKEFSNMFPNMPFEFQSDPFGLLKQQSTDSIWKQRMQAHQRFIEEFLKRSLPKSTKEAEIKREKV
ncbi:hypothetical protein C8N46_10457 [Kordia periserrulae]|uniref:GLPGLI family protein n=1 Tax=Kordia periserrulae TaxID=701523 RepID=A0A2T6BZB2_9FLAO|nr:hypothetical protein [Kordia periserrulae]PTX61414.1 hypothetical protein C8N46_10457 [Kordia periserrulae]